MKVTVSGYAGEGKSAVVYEIMYLLSKLGFEVEVHSIEQVPLRRSSMHEACLTSAIKHNPRIMLVEDHGEKDFPPAVFLIDAIHHDSTDKT